MDPRKCPGCGSPLGSGTLAGQCPRCLFAGDPRAQVTEDDHSDARERAAAAVGVLQADADSSASAHESGANDAAPLQDLVIGRRTDPIPRDEPDSFPPPHLAPVDPAVTWSDRAPAPRIEGYEVLREIKQGGQGVVYLAVQRSTKRKVAVKVLLAGMFASKPARRRFEREIELVASLKHPNIISVFDSGSTPEGHDYYVMDYVRGVPLTQHVREKGLGLEQVLAMFATTCEAVNHAHLRGVIHRDLKPSNILVDADGNVRVLDFGLAKALIEPAESIVSVTGNMVGTFPYMSPEQTRANPDEMDTRTDVYALGVVLYEALTGKHPYPVTGNVADIVRHIVETPPASPARTWTGESGVRPASGPGRRRKPGRCPIDGDLETILLKALSKERERRYDNAGHFARDIRRYLGNEPIVARRASAWYQLRMFSRRNRALVVASVGIFVGLILGVVTTTWFAVKLKAANTQLKAATEAIGNFMAFGGDERADNEDLLAASNLYLRALQEARGYGQSGSAILAGLVEIGTRPGGDIPLLGSYGGAYGSGVFRGHSAKPNNVAILHASRRALTSGDDGELILWDLDSGRRVAALTTGHGRIAYVAASPDGKWALTGGEDGTVRRWRVDPLAEVETLLTARAAKPDEEGNFKTEPVWMVAISHDGNRVLAGTSTGQIILRDADGMSRVVGECDGESAAALAFVPGDTRFALSGDGHGFIRLWDVDAGRQVWTKPHQQSGQVNSLVFSPDGESVATASHGNTLVVWQASGKGAGFRLTQRFKPIVGTSLLWRVAYAPDGKHVATAARGGGVTVYDAKSGALSRQFRAQRGDTMGLEFLDDNTLVSTGDATLNGRGEPLNSALMVWDLTERAGVTVSGGVKGMSVDDGGAVRVTNGAGGETLLYVGRDGALHSSIPSGGTSARPRWSDESDGSDRATDPNWAQGGRSGPRPASDHAGPPTPPVELFKLADGSVKLYGGADGTLQFWGTPKPPPGEAAGLPVPMRVFHGHQGQVTVAAVSRNGRYIVSADASGTVLAWDLYRPLAGRDLERKLRAANDQLNKNPSDPAALLALNDWFAFRGREVVRH